MAASGSLSGESSGSGSVGSSGLELADLGPEPADSGTADHAYAVVIALVVVAILVAFAVRWVRRADANRYQQAELLLEGAPAAPPSGESIV